MLTFIFKLIKISKTALFLLFLFSFNFALWSQEKPKTNLIDFLNYIKKEENINFSYNDDFVNSIEIETSREKISFEELKSILLKMETVQIEKINDSYAIFEKKRELIITGTFIDFFTKKGVSQVLIGNKHSHTFSEDDGSFEIKTELNDSLIIRHSGYLPQNIIADQKTANQKVFTLLEGTNTLTETIVISNYLNKSVNKNIDGSLEFDFKKEAILPGLVINDVGESLQLFPGVNSPSESATDLNIRGGTHDHNLFLWDSIKIFHAGHFFDQFSIFNSFIIDNIKIYRSAPSVKYQDIVSGIIDITSKSGIPKKTHSDFGISLTNANLGFEIPFGKKVGVLIAGRKSINTVDFKNNIIKKKVFQNTNIDPSIVDNENVSDFDQDFSYYDINAKVIYKPNANSNFQISTIASKDALEASSSFLLLNDLPPEFLLDFDLLQNNVDTFDIENYGLSLKWDYQINKKWKQHIGTYYSLLDFNFLSERKTISSPKQEDIPDTNSEAFSKNKINDYAANYTINYQHSTISNYLFGIEFNSSKLNYTESNSDVLDITGFRNVSIDNNINSYTLFSEYTFSNSIWFIKSGIRLSYYDHINSIRLKPRAVATLKINSVFRINFSAEIKNQLIRKSLLSADTRFASYRQAWIIADNSLNIPILNSNQGTIGFTYKKKNTVIDADFFIKENDGLTFFDPNAERANNTNVFIGSGKVYGLDFLAKTSVQNFTTWFNYSYNKNLVSFKEIQDADFSSNNDITHYINWSSQYTYKNANLGLSYTYRSGLPFSNPTATVNEKGEPVFVYNDINGNRLPDYKSLDGSISYTIKNKKHEFFKVKYGFMIKNLLNSKNILNRNFGFNQLFKNDTPITGLNDTEFFRFDDFNKKLNWDVFIQISF